MKFYVFCKSKWVTDDIADFWEWLLQTHPDVKITERDIMGNIEFSCSEETANRLMRLHEIDYGELFEGELNEYYDMLGL